MAATDLAIFLREDFRDHVVGVAFGLASKFRRCGSAARCAGFVDMARRRGNAIEQRDFRGKRAPGAPRGLAPYRTYRERRGMLVLDACKGRGRWRATGFLATAPGGTAAARGQTRSDFASIGVSPAVVRSRMVWRSSAVGHLTLSLKKKRSSCASGTIGASISSGFCGEDEERRASGCCAADGDAAPAWLEQRACVWAWRD